MSMFRECHTCPLDGTGSYECVHCVGPRDGPAPASGQNISSIEAFQSAGGDIAQLKTVDGPDTMNAGVHLASHLIRQWLGLPVTTRSIVAMRLMGWGYAVIAAAVSRDEHRPITLQACQTRLKACIATNKAIALLFGEMVEKQKRRRNAQP